MTEEAVATGDVSTSVLWQDVDQNAAAAASYLDLAAELGAANRRRATESLQLVPGQRVIEIGCGNGGDAEAMARRVSPGGQVVATDISAVLLEKAAERLAGLGLPLTFEVADAHYLPFYDDSFDAARVERVLQHLPDAARAVREMVRVVRPGGRIVALEPDWDTLVISADPVHVTRALRQHKAETWLGNPNIGRDTPHLFQRAGCVGLVVEAASGATRSFEIAEKVVAIRMTLAGAVEAGKISQADVESWLADAIARDRAGSFYACLGSTIVPAVVGGPTTPQFDGPE